MTTVVAISVTVTGDVGLRSPGGLSHLMHAPLTPDCTEVSMVGYLKVFEVVRHTNQKDEVVWRVQRKMKPPFFGTYTPFKSKKAAELFCKQENDRFNKVVGK